MDTQTVEFARLCRVIEAVGWGCIERIVIEDGVPTAVDALVHLSLRENVGGRLRKLGLDKKP